MQRKRNRDGVLNSYLSFMSHSYVPIQRHINVCIVIIYHNCPKTAIIFGNLSKILPRFFSVFRLYPLFSDRTGQRKSENPNNNSRFCLPYEGKPYRKVALSDCGNGFSSMLRSVIVVKSAFFQERPRDHRCPDLIRMDSVPGDVRRMAVLEIIIKNSLQIDKTAAIFFGQLTADCPIRFLIQSSAFGSI